MIWLSKFLDSFRSEATPNALSLQEYLAVIRGLPLPTSAQRREFVEYVSGAHSWYKHLPRHLPGEPFYFFMDRYAGCDCVVRKDGSRAMVEREKQGFHYSAIPTAEYRTRFGYLGYACDAGTAVFLVNQEPMAIPRDDVAAVPGDDGHGRGLPHAILEAGKVRLTAVIHPLSTAYDFWDEGDPRVRGKVHWPDESGGKETLQKIFKRCAEMREPGYHKEREARVAKRLELLESSPTRGEARKMMESPYHDPILSELLEPERLRQKNEMLKAIDRVCRVVQEGGSFAGAQS
jgi:hypothetical protein